MNQAGRQSMMAGKRLPYDAEVEYLESTGTQWIDTGVKANWDLKVDSEFRVTQKPTTNDFKWFFASRDVDSAGAGFGCGWNQNKYLISDYGGGRSVSNMQSSAGNYTIVKDKNVCTINSLVLTNTASQFSQTHTLPIFGLILANGSMQGMSIPYASCSKFRIYLDGVLVRDFQPVRFTNELGQTEGAMFDRVNPTVGMNPDGSARADGLYRNRGTGAFVIGPDL